MKSLKYVQLIFKIGKILALVAFVFCIVAASLTALSLVLLPLAQGALSQVRIDGRTIEEFVMDRSGVSLSASYVSLAVSLVFYGAGIYLTRITYRYFEHELEDGTPFTHRGAKEMRDVALQHVFVSLACIVLCAIGLAIYHFATHDSIDLDNRGTLWFGIGLFLFSLLVDYGADVREGAPDAPTETPADPSTAPEQPPATDAASGAPADPPAQPEAETPADAPSDETRPAE